MSAVLRHPVLRFRPATGRIAAIAALLVLVASSVLGGLNRLQAMREDNRRLAHRRLTAAVAAQIDDSIFNRVWDGVRALAEAPSIRAVAAGRSPVDDAEALTALDAARRSFRAALVYVLNEEGTTVACTPYGQGQTLTGKNYAFRPYYLAARAGRTHACFAVGVTTGERGLYFSAPVRDTPESPPTGALVVKVGFEPIDEVLARLDRPAALLSEDGVVVAAHHPDWLYRCALPLDPARRTALIESRQFAEHPLDPLPVGLAGATVSLAGRLHHIESEAVSVPGWRVVVLDRDNPGYPLTASQVAAAWFVTGFGAVLLCSLALLGVNVGRRRRAEETLRQLNQNLEQRVRERTEQLAQLNAGLQAEVRERLAAAEALRRSEQRSKDIISFLPDATFVIDTEGRVTAWNRAMEELTGVPAEDILGKGDYAYSIPFYGHRRPALADWLLTGDDAIARRYTNVVQKGDVWVAEAEAPALRAGSATLWVAAKRLCDENGRVVGVIEAVRDITDIRKAHERLRQQAALLKAQNQELAAGREYLQAQKLDLVEANRRLQEAIEAARSASRSKSEFLANMSHEIRTPMTAILGFIDVLEETVSALEGQARASALDCIRTVRRNGRHLLQIINDILDLSKIEAGKLEVESVRCHPAQLVADVCALMRPRAEEKGLSLEVQWEGAIPEAICSDPTRLRQILINLVGNAVKFTETGSVRVCVRYLPAPDGADGAARPTMQFEVIDTGIGMTPEQCARLFEPFEQGDTSTTRRFGGTGLGLAISRRLAERLGGTIEVFSTPGAGSTLRLTVAAAPAEGAGMTEPPPARETSPEAEPPAGSEEAGRLERCRILLAEDAVDNRKLISHFLRRAGAALDMAENGQEAVRMATEAAAAGRAYDAVLMDMQMPVMDGYEATRRLRAAGYRGAIIALTANAMAGDHLRCTEAGCDAYATKPIRRDLLIELILRHVRPAEVAVET